ncbi:MAG: sigma-70 family RNA polymerase sigma factor, partial [Candidatus Omnitrophica bacterium]|nr:sigma-70 family RNA polymerase sigma factor [Candidatus Omnitrophota bacterium]
MEIVRTKNKEVYAEIIKRYQTKLIRYATYITNDGSMGADAVQESFTKAYVNLNSFNIKKKFSSWIYRIVHNETMNIINKQKRQQ